MKTFTGKTLLFGTLVIYGCFLRTKETNGDLKFLFIWAYPYLFSESKLKFRVRKK